MTVKLVEEAVENKPRIDAIENGFTTIISVPPSLINFIIDYIYYLIIIIRLYCLIFNIFNILVLAVIYKMKNTK